jgi:hypothetical protein
MFARSPRIYTRSCAVLIWSRLFSLGWRVSRNGYRRGTWYFRGHRGIFSWPSVLPFLSFLVSVVHIHEPEPCEEGTVVAEFSQVQAFVYLADSIHHAFICTFIDQFSFHSGGVHATGNCLLLYYIEVTEGSILFSFQVISSGGIFVLNGLPLTVSNISRWSCSRGTILVLGCGISRFFISGYQYIMLLRSSIVVLLVAVIPAQVESE